MKTDNLNNFAVLVMESPRYSVMPRSESAVAKNLRRHDPDLVINYFNIDDYQRRQPAVNGNGETNSVAAVTTRGEPSRIV